MQPEEKAVTVIAERPKRFLQIIEQIPDLIDLTTRYTDEDKDVPCFFASRSEYEKRDPIKTYHPHDFTIRINGHRIWICKRHFKELVTIATLLKIEPLLVDTKVLNHA